MSRLQGEKSIDSGLADVVMGLVEDMTTLKQSLMDERWQALSRNLEVINSNLISLHERVERLEYDARRKPE